jgi:predicted TIM-barrel fold metal-dependent hydrolase
MHVGGEEPPNAAAHPVAGGLPSTFGEYHVLRAQPVMTHLMSVIAQGVLERHRDLRVVAVGAGMAWLPGWLWRFDSDFRAYGSDETPWLKRSPSEQLVEQVRVATYSFGAIQDVSGFQRLLGSAPWLSATLCYGGGFPRWDADSPDTVAAAFPPGWRDAVLRDNALAAFRWPDR